MRLQELDYTLPAGSIAQHAAEPRDSCRLLRLSLSSGVLGHHVFADLPRLLHPGDLLVLNDSRVLPARVGAHRETGGRVELLFLRVATPATSRSGEVWEALARPSSRLRAGNTLRLAGREPLQLLGSLGEGRWLVQAPVGVPVEGLLEHYGCMPLPPYIKAPLTDPTQYQTVYARAPGSAAAPTAGLHFTADLLARLGEAGVETARVTLHVGLDTFRPVTEETVEAHAIHMEAYSVTEAALASIDAARRDGRRVVAVGTTSVRVLETLYAGSAPGEGPSAPLCGTTRVFITPGYRFRAVDALLTNFHLPRSSLLALVMAFAGAEQIRRAYECAVREGYRFFSFGDAMLMDGETGDGQ